MTEQQHFDLLQEGVKTWNSWRNTFQEIRPDLAGAILIDFNLRNFNLSRANLKDSDLIQADLSGADLSGADLKRANLSGVIFKKTNLSKAYFGETVLIGSNLSGLNLTSNIFYEANLSEATLEGTNLSKAILNRANLSGANLSDAILEGANFNNADLSGSNLRGTNFNNADLSNANLTGAILEGADLSGANLGGATFSGTVLEGANFSKARTFRTIFDNLDLRKAKGLETIIHSGPSSITTSTLERSEGEIPEIFLRGIGLGDTFITYVHSLVQSPIQYYTCFISYSSEDQVFAERLYTDMQSKGIRCWYAPEDLKIGDHFPETIDNAIHIYDKLLVILSKNSVHSLWVANEVKAAQEKEKRFRQEEGLNKTVLFPVTIDQAIEKVRIQWVARMCKQRHIGNFVDWKNHDSYQKAFQRLLRDLKADAIKQEQNE